MSGLKSESLGFWPIATSYTLPLCLILSSQGDTTSSTVTPSDSLPTSMTLLPSKYTLLPSMPMGLGPMYSAGGGGGGGAGWGGGGGGGGGTFRFQSGGAKKSERPSKRRS